MRCLAWIPLLAAIAAWPQGSLSDSLTQPDSRYKPDAKAESALGLPSSAEPSDSLPAAPDYAALAWPQDSLSTPLANSYLPAGPGSSASFGQAEPGLFFDLRAATPFDDFQMGGRAGFSVGKRILTDIFFDMEARPYRRAVHVRVSEDVEYQYREERLTFGPGALVRFPLGPAFAVTAGGGLGLSPAWYRGSNREARSSGLGWLETGFRLLSSSGADWGLSYQFFPLPGVSPHRVSFSFGYRTGSR